jgi:uncharacterized protein (TIRG00374 family)
MKIIKISWVVGVVLFALLVIKIGPGVIWQNIHRFSLRDFLILMGLRLVYWGLRTLCWKIVFERLDGGVGFPRLFASRLAGHAISYLTPSAHIGGEPVRALMVGHKNRRISFASVIVDKTIEIMTMILLMCTGVVLGLTRISLPGKNWIMMVAVVLSVGGLTVLIYYKQRTGLFAWMRDLLAKVHINPAIFIRNADRIKETDHYISLFHREHRGAFFGVFFFYLGLGFVWILEIHITLRLLGVTGVSFFDSFLIVSLGNLAFLLPAIPAAIGTYEATYVGIFLLLGLGSGTAIALTLIRRILALIWAGVGLLAMAVYPGKHLLDKRDLFFGQPEEVDHYIKIDDDSEAKQGPQAGMEPVGDGKNKDQ